MRSLARPAGAVALVVLAVVGAWALGVRLGASERATPPPAAPLVTLPPGAPARLTPLPFVPPAGSSSFGGESLLLTPDGRTLLSADRDGQLSVLDLATGTQRTVAVGAPHVIQGGETLLRHDLAISPDGRLAYLTDGYGQALRIVDMAGPAVVATVAVPAPPTAVAAAPDGRHVEVGDTTGSVTTVDTTSRAVTGSVRVAPGPIHGLTVTPDGRRLIAATMGSRTLTILDTGDTRVAASTAVALPHPVASTSAGNTSAEGTSVAVDPGGRRAYVVTAASSGPAPHLDDGVTVLDLDTAAVVTTLAGDRTEAVAVSPDGRHLYLARDPDADSVIGTQPQLVVEARDITTGYRQVGALADTVGNYGVSAVRPSPDGRHLYLLEAGILSAVDLR